MRVIVAGLGIQGRKRLAVAGADVISTVDPLVSDARYRRIEEVPLDSFDAAVVCTPDSPKLQVLAYLLSNKKHVLVEKPLLADNDDDLLRLRDLARTHHVTCYTAYNHRFEPHVAQAKKILDGGTIGRIYQARLFYGNGTAANVRQSPWRDTGLGVLPDLGSHLFDMCRFLFGSQGMEFRPWSFRRFENNAFDHVICASSGPPLIECEMTLLSWRNTFSLDILASEGSLHIDGLCKWGPSTLTTRKRILPSGRPTEEIQVLTCPDPTWKLEYDDFKNRCETGATNLDADVWLNLALKNLQKTIESGKSA